MNPVGKFLRALTKKSRTEDGQSLRVFDMAEIKKVFKPGFCVKSFYSFRLELSLECCLRVGRML